MSKFKYFAYGSNMLSCRLQARTPSARPVSLARLDGYRLTFQKVSNDGSGKCHIECTSLVGDSVIGVLFEIEVSEKQALDKAEGLGFGYDEQLVNVVIPSGEIVEAQSYVGTSLSLDVRPYCWYKSFVVNGAKEHGIPAEYIQQLEDVAYIVDPDAARKSRNEQISARSKLRP